MKKSKKKVAKKKIKKAAPTSPFLRIVLTKPSETFRGSQLCGLLRGLLYAVGNSDGHTRKNQDFYGGTVIDFGSPAIATEFSRAVRYFLKDEVRQFIRITRPPAA